MRNLSLIHGILPTTVSLDDADEDEYENKEGNCNDQADKPTSRRCFFGPSCRSVYRRKRQIKLDSDEINANLNYLKLTKGISINFLFVRGHGFPSIYCNYSENVHLGLKL